MEEGAPGAVLLTRARDAQGAGSSRLRPGTPSAVLCMRQGSSCTFKVEIHQAFPAEDEQEQRGGAGGAKFGGRVGSSAPGAEDEKGERGL